MVNIINSDLFVVRRINSSDQFSRRREGNALNAIV
jgi:hypothetical protein